MSINQDNFDLFGNDIIQCFYDIATVTGEPVRKKTLKYVEHLANRWKYTIMQRGWKEVPEEVPSPYEVIDAIIGMYCMERVGIRHDVKVSQSHLSQHQHSFTHTHTHTHTRTHTHAYIYTQHTLYDLKISMLDQITQ